MMPKKDDKGRYPSHTDLGCYPIMYITKGCDVLCADCASRETDWDWEKPIDADVYWEGPTMQCSDCNADMESAYGDPDEPEPEPEPS